VILYLSAYATYGFYDLLPHPVAFGLMVGVTLIAVWRGVAHDSVVVALMAATGGLTTPAWLSTGVMNTVGLWTYLVLLSVGMYGLALWRPQWRVVAYIISAGTACWWGLWTMEVSSGSPDVVPGALFMLISMAIFLAYDHKRGTAPAPYHGIDIAHVTGWLAIMAMALSANLIDSAAATKMIVFGAAAVLTGVAAFAYRWRSADAVMQGVLGAASIVLAFMMGFVPDDPTIVVIVSSAVAIAGITLFGRMESTLPVYAARAVASMTAVYFLVDPSGALVIDLEGLAILNLRTLAYLVLTAAAVRTWSGVAWMDAIAWMVPFVWIYAEVHDAVWFAVNATVGHDAYAAMLSGAAAIVPVGAVAWMFARRAELRALSIGAVLASTLATVFWCATALRFDDAAQYVSIMNIRLGTGLVLAGGMAVFVLIRRMDVPTALRWITSACLVASTFLLASTESIWPLVVQMESAGSIVRDTLLNRIHLSLSGVWIAYASVVVALGFWRHIRVVRFGGIALLGVAVCKVFLYDLRYLEQPYRIFSFVALGVILLGASYAYTRFKDRILSE
jgi:uncharacterized membrane protein